MVQRLAGSLAFLGAILLLPAAASAQSIQRASAKGSTLTIQGASFGTAPGTLALGNGTALGVGSWSATQVVATIPQGTAAGTYELRLTRADGLSVVYSLTIGAAGSSGTGVDSVTPGHG